MTERISLVEAYDNRDVIAQLVRLRDNVDELLNILKDIDPNGDLTNVVTKTGDQTIDGEKTFIGKIIADCDIIQNGGNYETHAEQVFTTNDYIVMRDGAVSGLGTGQFSGFQVKKYNGSDDGRLVMDSSGVARVGDIGDEQPLATRDEASNMTSGALVKWDGVNKKMIAPASNVGDDTRPIYLVNGAPVVVANPFALASDTAITTGTCALVGFTGTPVTYTKVGRVVQLSFSGITISGTGYVTVCNLPFPEKMRVDSMAFQNTSSQPRHMIAESGILKIYGQPGDTTFYGTIIYMTDS